MLIVKFFLDNEGDTLLIRQKTFDMFPAGWIQSIALGRHSQIGKAAVCKTVYSRFKSGCRLHFLYPSFGRVVELADTTDLKSVARKGLRVQVPPRPPIHFFAGTPLSVKGELYPAEELG